LQIPEQQEDMDGFSAALEGKFNSRPVLSLAKGNSPTSSMQSSSTQIDIFINFPLQALSER
jgi:hypothetical protein